VRVLIVDDQEAFRGVARDVVASTQGCELAGEAVSGEEAVEMARATKPDFILMDFNLPGIGGIEATRRILAEHREGVRVLLMSTYSEDEMPSEASTSGAIGFLNKADLSPETLTSYG
jgi:DNA-binding NarL/FixJ family response regulator